MMKLSKIFRAKKYLFEIYFAITITAVIIVTAVLWSIYYAIKGNMLDLERQMSFEILTQMKNNTEFMSQTSKDICMSAFYNYDVQNLLYTTQGFSEEVVRSLNRVTDNYLAANPTVDSIYIYNSVRKEYYSTKNGIYNVDDELLKSIKAGKFRSGVNPVVHFINDKPVVTFYMSESYSNGSNNSAIYVNMKLDWLMNYMDSVNRIGEVETGSLYVFDQNMECINSYDNAKDSTNYKVEKILKSKLPTMLDGKNMQVSELQVGREKYAVTILNVEDYGWNLVRVYPYYQLFSGMNKIRFTILIVNVITVLCITFLVMLLAMRIYKPINSLVNNINMPDDPDSDGGSEFERLEKYYIHSKDELRQLEMENQKHDTVLREHALVKLLTKSDELSDSEIDEFTSEFNVAVDLSQPMAMILLMVDDFRKLKDDYDVNCDKPLVLFGIVNILHEIYSKYYKCECILTNNHCIAILYNVKPQTNETVSTIELAKRAEKMVKPLFNLTFSIVVSGEVDSFIKISECYEFVLDRFKYRFMLGEKCIITDKTVNERRGQIFVDYSYDEETAFLKSLAEIKTPQSQKLLSELVDKIKQLDFSSACIATTHLTKMIQASLFEINKCRKEPITISGYMDKWLSIPNIILDEYEKSISQFIESLQNDYISGSSKHQVIAETIQEYINKMYDDCELSATTIAEILKISPTHAGRIFNQYMNMSIPEYINYIRLKKVTEWMRNSDLTIQEIMIKVGYQNESYFYKMFKDKFNMSPRTYMKTLSK